MNVFFVQMEYTDKSHNKKRLTSNIVYLFPYAYIEKCAQNNYGASNQR